MKKMISWMLCIMLMLTAACACAETAEPFFGTFAGIEWSFSSGVGAWSTDLRILEDGSFAGEFHDSEMGESAETYPNGTVYGCSFTGTMSLAETVDENTWKIRVDTLTMDEGQVPEAIDDGIRYVTTEPYGISAGDEMLLYKPGTPVEALPEELVFWAHVMDQENPPAALETWFLCSAKNESGFVGFAAEPAVGMINPWVDLTAEELLAESGLSFGVPEGAKNVIYRYLPSQGLAEMQFTIDGDEFCARILPVALEEGQLMNISGMYFAWEYEEPVTVGRCPGTIGQAQTGSEDWVELCQWYDLVPGLMYSLSVSTTDLDGLDLTAVAEQVYVPVQGEV
ncbi:MAG: hypothetical protein IKH38_02955 [Clostridia bacterium]|nr:hypothetical protein [Clostridia bacterium]